MPEQLNQVITSDVADYLSITDPQISNINLKSPSIIQKQQSGKCVSRDMSFPQSRRQTPTKSATRYSQIDEGSSHSSNSGEGSESSSSSDDDYRQGENEKVNASDQEFFDHTLDLLNGVNKENVDIE